MAKDKGDTSTEKNIEYNSAAAEKIRNDSVKKKTKEQLAKNLNPYI